MRHTRIALALLALAAALALPAAAATTADTMPSGIAVTGNAAVKAPPDLSRWSFGVQAEGATASAALRATSAAMRKVIAALKEAGVAPRDLQTDQVSLSPKTNKEGAVVGYQAANSVTATIRAIATTGAIVDAAVEAGGTNVSGPSFERSDKVSLYRQALAEALADARAKAKVLADAAGVTLGKATSITESGSGPIVFAAKADATSGAEEVPVEPGETTIDATVAVTFAIA